MISVAAAKASVLRMDISGNGIETWRI